MDDETIARRGMTTPIQEVLCVNITDGSDIIPWLVSDLANLPHIYIPIITLKKLLHDVDVKLNILSPKIVLCKDCKYWGREETRHSVILGCCNCDKIECGSPPYPYFGNDDTKKDESDIMYYFDYNDVEGAGLYVCGNFGCIHGVVK